MTATVPPAARTATGVSDLRRSGLSSRRRVTNRAAMLAITLALLLAVIPLALVVWEVIAKGLDVLSWQFLTEDIPNSYRRRGPGMGPAIIGTLIITGAASLLSSPLGVVGAI